MNLLKNLKLKQWLMIASVIVATTLATILIVNFAKYIHNYNMQIKNYYNELADPTLEDFIKDFLSDWIQNLVSIRLRFILYLISTSIIYLIAIAQPAICVIRYIKYKLMQKK